MDFKGLLKDKFVQVLLFVFVLNVIIFCLLWRLDIFVNTDLYSSGLRFNLDWAKDYWYNRGMVWGFQIGCVMLSAISIIPHYRHSQEPRRFRKWLGFLLPTLAGACQVVAIVFLTRVDYIVQNRLGDYGLILNFDWTAIYNLISATLFALMVTVLVALSIPVARTLGAFTSK